MRRGWFTLTGTFDGDDLCGGGGDAARPPPDHWDFEIPCPTPEGGWQVVDASLVTQDDYFRGELGRRRRSTTSHWRP